MARRNSSQLAYQAIRIEGTLIPADELSRLTTLQTPGQTEQIETHFGVPKGLKLRDEIARYRKIAQNLWADLQTLRIRQDVNAHDATVSVPSSQRREARRRGGPRPKLEGVTCIQIFAHLLTFLSGDTLSGTTWADLVKMIQRDGA